MTSPWSPWDRAVRWACAAGRALEDAGRAARPLFSEIQEALETWSRLRR